MEGERLCPCHGEPMYVRPDGRSRCRVKSREARRRYEQTGKAQTRSRAWRRSGGHLEAQKRYQETPAGQATIFRSHLNRRRRKNERDQAQIQELLQLLTEGRT